jgi:hypothetical protein
MNASIKLKGIPKIYYLNYDHRNDKDDYMKSQFSELEIIDYQRVSRNRFHHKNYSKWKDVLLDEKLFQTEIEVANTITHLQTIIDWYDNDTSEYCIIMDDNINLTLSKYWMFDWNSLIKNLPYNWDCMQLFTIVPKDIPMHLRQKDENSRSTSCYMITRHFAKKIKFLHYFDGKFKLYINNKNLKIPEFEYGTLDQFLYELGITYTLPIFNLNTKFSTDTEEDDEDLFKDILNKLCSESIEYWWNIKSKKYSMYEFFTYNKRYDWRMEVQFDIKDDQVYKERDSKIILWI